MYLKSNINVVEFMRRVRECKDEVTLHTTEGDILNLHSVLCQMIFSVAAAKEHIIHNAKVICENETDYDLIRDFINEYPE